MDDLRRLAELRPSLRSQIVTMATKYTDRFHPDLTVLGKVLEALDERDALLDRLAAAESQREALDVETLTTVLATFDRQWPIEQRAGTYEIVEVDERTFAERIVAALKEQPR